MTEKRECIKMEQISCNSLNELQKQQVAQLVEICNQFDHTAEELFLSNEYHFYLEMDCFFLLYVQQELIGVLSVYADKDDFAEISACVRPDMRRRGYFKQLYQACQKQLEKFDYRHLYFKTYANAPAAHEIVKRKGAVFSSAEYLMCYQQSIQNYQPICGLEVCRAQQSHIVALAEIQVEAFGETLELAQRYVKQAMSNPKTMVLIGTYQDQIVSCCSVDTTGKRNYIFGLAVRTECQHKGIGTSTLCQVVALLQQEQREISLGVEAENAPALSMYQHCGFQTITEYQYYQIEI